ncbi:MAG: VOC family protein [Actinomycetota bacterium]|nr:VOC family protein [Actinomycetota bacterium]
MTRHVQVTFDAVDPHRLAAWWCDLLGYEIESGDEIVSQLLQSGVVGESDVLRIDGRLFFADALAAVDPEGNGPRFYFQRVPEQKIAKNRVHLDVPIDGEMLDDAVTRLVGRGAQFIEFGEHPGHRWAVMRDPEGNEFCLQ